MSRDSRVWKDVLGSLLTTNLDGPDGYMLVGILRLAKPASV